MDTDASFDCRWWLVADVACDNPDPDVFVSTNPSGNLSGRRNVPTPMRREALLAGVQAALTRER
jgi:hypothetical protein